MGGLIALKLGHPNRSIQVSVWCCILVTLLYSLKKQGGRRGVAVLCIDSGMGIVMYVC